MQNYSGNNQRGVSFPAAIDRTEHPAARGPREQRLGICRCGDGSQLGRGGIVPRLNRHTAGRHRPGFRQALGTRGQELLDPGAHGPSASLSQTGGPIDTDMNPHNGPFAAMLKQFMAVGHYGAPDDIANAVAFLASPKAQYITGSTLTVDGGANA